MIRTISSFISEAIEELNHVRWPTRQQAVRLSVIVLVFTLVSSVFFGFLDFVFSESINFLLTLVP